MIAVYCAGPLDVPHDRFIVAAYRRAHPTATSTPALWTPERVFGGTALQPVEHAVQRPDGSLSLRFQHWCDLCRFDGEYSAEPFIGALFAVLDAAWFSGRAEIDAREFDAACRSYRAGN